MERQVVSMGGRLAGFTDVLRSRRRPSSGWSAWELPSLHCRAAWSPGRGDGCPVAKSTWPSAGLAAGEPDHQRALAGDQHNCALGGGESLALDARKSKQEVPNGP